MAALSVAVAAAPLWMKVVGGLAGAAYVDAKHGIAADFRLLRTTVYVRRQLAKNDKADRNSLWYQFEKTALEKLEGKGEELCYICEGKTWTWKRVYFESVQLALRLKALGLKRKDVICMFMTNKPGFPIIWLACLLIDVLPAFLNTTLSSHALEHCIRVSGATAIIYDVELEPQLGTVDSSCLGGLKKLRWRDEFNASLPGVVNPDVEVREGELVKEERAESVGLGHVGNRDGITWQDPSCLIYTSGTTGLPKPASCTHGRVGSAFYAWPTLNGVKSSDRLYTALPLYHSSGSWTAMGASWQSNTTLIIGRKFSATRFWDEVRKQEATVIQYIGEMVRFLMSQPERKEDKEHRVRLAFGNGLRPEVWQRFRERFGIKTISEFYGASEGIVAMFNYNTGPYGAGALTRYGALLHALTKNDIAIIKVDALTEEPVRDSQGLCIRVEPNEPGEVLGRINKEDFSKNFRGYYGNDEATNKKIATDVFEKGDAWFRSGDLMRVNEDGQVFFVDRMGDTFRWKSENVSTNEVATTVSALNEVTDVNVYGVEVPSHDGRAGCAAIVARPGFDFDKLASHVTKELPGYARPLFLRLVAEMQTTGTMKHQKVHLRNEGIDLSKVKDQILWLRNGRYVPFGKEEWEQVKAGKVRL
ncbi:putative bifunctional fatty acid transporter/acyl-CoA synthetase FAT1 [Atractiella rhizophila]|nr:putative bifunctional fatty acid transporter/acyl-CoA synthetase FAT1 [Atractiella rhizophila]